MKFTQVNNNQGDVNNIGPPRRPLQAHASTDKIWCPGCNDGFPQSDFARMGWTAMTPQEAGYYTECPQCGSKFVVQVIMVALYVSPLDTQEPE